jgi:phage gpG-like protein
MGTYRNIDEFMASLNQKVKQVVPKVVAETATEYYKERFRTKEWDSKPWPPTKRFVKRGSLMVRTSSLANSIRPSLVTHTKVRISAGNSKVPYAKVHNEGGKVHPRVTAKMRKWAWANYYKEAKLGSENTYTSWSPSKSHTINFYKGLALTKKNKLDIKIPRRQFMGHSQRLNAKIQQRIMGLLKNI